MIRKPDAPMPDEDALRIIREKLTGVIVSLLDSADLLRKAGAGGDTGFAIGQALSHTTRARELIERDIDNATRYP